MPNIPLPIGFEKTISQPFIVALMTDLLDVMADDSVLEIGTGLGYQAAVLAQLARKVYSVEIIEELGQKAKQRLRQQGCSNVELKIANGYHGWPEHAPFDKVIVTAAPDLIPLPLIHQLKAGGKMVIPVGAAAHSGGETRQRQNDDEGDPVRPVLSTRGEWIRLVISWWRIGSGAGPQ
ncbi:protein-L-isoaspartate O-methyltransferase family protein [Bradyrhizobium centrolobii]|uniref:protein-L-isoaspartate O-methyltransferase family protein n=1 Tax=Bradyrhizobium centrolobii TaxID=1505087 RepID=UPI00191BB00C|nr:protein-L-isoaspartate O-methyltransferase [Bradyrhizobium centrolobii]